MTVPRSSPTVSTSAMPGYDCVLHILWQPEVAEADVEAAFASALRLMEQVQQQTHIVLDALHNPRFPLRATLNSMLRLQNHPGMGRWLVLGTRPSVRLLVCMVMAIARDNIEWYATEDAAHQRLRQLPCTA